MTNIEEIRQKIEVIKQNGYELSLESLLKEDIPLILYKLEEAISDWEELRRESIITDHIRLIHVCDSALRKLYL